MEPRVIALGNQGVQRGALGLLGASMEPRVIALGNRPRRR